MSLESRILKKEEYVVVTGAGRGIGRAIAERFAKHGYRLALISSTKEVLEEVQKSCIHLGSPEVILFCADLSIDVEWPEDWKGLNVGMVVNNAGRFSMDSAKSVAQKDAFDAWKRNVLPAVQCNRFFLERLKHKKRGLLLHIGSVASEQGRAYAAAYSSAKHALLGYVRSLRLDLMEAGIAVSVINPGQTYTHSWAGSSVDPKEIMAAEDIAEVAFTISQLSPRSVVEDVTMNPIRGDREPY